MLGGPSQSFHNTLACPAAHLREDTDSTQYLFSAKDQKCVKCAQYCAVCRVECAQRLMCAVCAVFAVYNVGIHLLEGAGWLAQLNSCNFLQISLILGRQSQLPTPTNRTLGSVLQTPHWCW